MAVGGEEEPQSGEGLGCPLCPAVCGSHTELQDHLMDAHVEQSGEEPAHSHTVKIRQQALAALT